MKTFKRPVQLIPFAVATAVGLTMSTSLSAGTLDNISKAVNDSKTKLQFRYRMETVDQDGIDKTANASTLKTRLSWASGKIGNLKLNIEVDNVIAFGDNYNSTSNMQTAYPVVADPEGTDVNQANIQYATDNLTVTAGRQRVLLGNQRFVGGVGWRQNEQTYDGYRVQYKFAPSFNVDYSYIYNVNRIFGPTGAAADLHGAIHLLDAGYKINDSHKLDFFRYALDFDTAAAMSSTTLGMKYTGKFNKFGLNATYATQSDYKDNPNNYSASYINLEGSYKFDNVKLIGGYESLGSDNSVAFSTPLATLHKFQGFADKFLGTPANGVEDTYITVAGALSEVKLAATYHTFSADTGGADLGTELDLVANYKLNKQTLLLAKYASYDADTHASDTDKFWFMVAVNF